MEVKVEELIYPRTRHWGEMGIIKNEDSPLIEEARKLPFVKTIAISMFTDVVTLDQDHTSLSQAFTEEEKVFEFPVGSTGVYVCSKIAMADYWKSLRNAGMNVSSSWIDREDVKEEDFPSLWEECIFEASTSSCLVVVRNKDQEFKGCLAEIGAALATGKPVFAYGIEEYTIHHHERVYNTKSSAIAIVAAALYDSAYGVAYDCIKMATEILQTHILRGK